ncbi:MAG: ornithine cyclodeaminase [Propionibacterium sp.]|nr:ornithine cyclodeaminase [Propionibacterium sp.]
MDQRIDFLYLSEPDMIAAGVRDIAAATDAMEETLILLSEGDYMMAGENGNSHGAMITFPEEPEHEGMPADGPDRRFMAMPAYLGGRFRATGVKWYGSNMANRERDLPRSIHVFVLNDADTGAPLAIMSANLLSAYRTAAVPNVGTKHLAREDVDTMAIIGPGVMSKTTFEGLVAQRPGIKHLRIKGRSPGSTNRAADEFREQYPQLESVTVVDTDRDAVTGAGVIITAANASPKGSSEFPQLMGEWLAPGALVLAPGAVAFDDEFLTGVRKVVDYQGLYDAWDEEYGTQRAYDLIGIIGSRFLALAQEGHFDASEIEQMGDIASGKIPGRKDDDEIIVYSVGGMPVEDVAWAHDVWRNAQERGIGQSLNLWETPAAR